ncbi:MAG: hypothetical protein U0M96_01810 [Eggerthellaceae bacterium]
MTDQGRSYSLITVEKADVADDSGSLIASSDTAAACQSSAVSTDFCTLAQDAASASVDDGFGKGYDASADKAEVESSPAADLSGKQSESALDGITEDDLKGSVPMEHMHRIIIALVVVGLVAFAVYLGIFA